MLEYVKYVRKSPALQTLVSATPVMAIQKPVNHIKKWVSTDQIWCSFIWLLQRKNKNVR